MLRWIESRRWLPEILMVLLTLLTASLSDYLISGMQAGLLSAAMAASLLVVRFQPWISLVAISGLNLAAALLGEPPLLGGISLTLVVFWVSYTAQRNIRYAAFLASLLFSALAIAATAIRANGVGELYGLAFSQWSEGLTASIAALSIIWLANLAAWLLGGIYRLKARHVGTPVDLAWLALENQRLETKAELADERLEHTREVLQQLLIGSSAIALQAEGGSFAAKRDESAGQRALQKITDAGRSQIAIIRKLDDELAEAIGPVSRLRFDLADAKKFAELLSQNKHRVTWRESGEAYELGDFSQRMLYRIIYEALDNFARHTPDGSEANLELAWSEDNLQIMVKDNGLRVIEGQSKISVDRLASLPVIDEPQGAFSEQSIDELPRLSHEVTGPGIRSMQLLAETIGGRVSVTRVADVGFQVVAIFPELKRQGRSLPGVED